MRIQANGIDVNYVVEGDGPWVVMSHSLGSNVAMWEEQAKVLSRRYKVLRYDTRGHGKTSAPSGAYTLDQLADDAKALMDALGVASCHWVGLSMGGMIGQVLALKHPGLLKTMVLADTTSGYGPEAKAMWNARIETAIEHGTPALVESTLERWFTETYRKINPDKMIKFGNWLRATPVEGYAGCCHAFPAMNVTDRLKELSCPTLIIVGAQDTATPPSVARIIHENKPDSELVVIPSAGHISCLEQPNAFNNALLEFLDRHAQ